VDAPSESGLPREDTHWLAILLGLSSAGLATIRAEVAEMVDRYAVKHHGKPRREIAYLVSNRLIKRGTLKAGGFGGLTATPSLVPGIGTLSGAVAGAAVDLAYLTKVQIDLCYRICAAYEVDMDPERLKAVTLALLGLAGSAELTKQVAATTMRAMIDRAAAKYLEKGLVEVAVELAERTNLRLLGRTCTLIPFLGIPFNASVNAASTIAIGKQARKYFSTWDSDVVLQP
jgi:uncharacterized protein (DUF697 family)